MPQCSKCGREISDYGLCSRCAAKHVVKPMRKKTVVCPVCKSKYHEAVGIDKYRCCDCDAVFTTQEANDEK